MKIKAKKQRNFTTSTMTSSGNYNAEFAQELAPQQKTDTTKSKNKPN